MKDLFNSPIKRKRMFFLAISLISFGVFLFFLISIFQKENDLVKNKSKYPLGLIYNKNYCIKECLVENENNKKTILQVGTICGVSYFNGDIYVKSNGMEWKVVHNNNYYFVELCPILKEIEPIMNLNNETNTSIKNELLDGKDNEQIINKNNLDKNNEQEQEQETKIENNSIQELEEKKETIVTTPNIKDTNTNENSNTNEIIDENKYSNTTPYFKPTDYVGTIFCENVGLDATLVLGESQDIIDRYDICVSVPPGSGEPIFCGGHSTKSLSCLKNMQVNDIIIIETNYGIYEYTVFKTAIGRVLIGDFGPDDYLKDINTGEELFRNKGEEILQIYTCATLNEEEKPTPYRYAVIAGLTKVTIK